MDCKVTCFDRVIYLTQEIPEHFLKQAVELATEYTFIDFLDFCVDCGCFTDAQKDIVYAFIVMWEDLDGNYWEEDHEKLNRLYDAVGLTKEVFEKYLKEGE